MGQGFFNQQMSFSAVIMELYDHVTNRTHAQVVLPSLVFIDFLGSNELIHFDRLFDVDYWNSYFPRLPRIVSHNQTQHFQYVVEKHAMVENETSYHHPFYVTTGHSAFGIYHNQYLHSLETGDRKELHPADKLILQGALRPAPAVQGAIRRIVGDDNFIAIHLRVEQDFLCFFSVEDRNLTNILAYIEKSLGPDPPVDRVYFAVNRPLLEDASNMPENPHPSAEACEAERQDNLAALNRAVRYGMWGGRAEVFERPPLEKQFQDRPIIFGSYIDSEICIHAKIFIGRFSSTFTKNIIRRRSILGLNESYKYDLDASGFAKMYGMAFPQTIEG